MQVPSGLEIFIDTNFFLYSISEHPKYGAYCERFLERVKSGDLKGKISVIVLNELLHKLIIGEIAEKKNINTFKAVSYIKKNREVLEDLKAYEILEEVEGDYNLTIVDIKKANFSLARKLMEKHHLLSNDALHLAVMKQEGIINLATSDADFDGIKSIKVWKPQENSE
jgi:predicted nucleic acid-binding protein